MRSTTFHEAVKFVGWAKSLPFVRHTVSVDEDFTIHTFGVSNPYTTVHSVACVTIRHPGKLLRQAGRRASANITTRIGARISDETVRRGLWDAQYALRETSKDCYSWSRRIAELSGSLDSSNL